MGGPAGRCPLDPQNVGPVPSLFLSVNISLGGSAGICVLLISVSLGIRGVDFRWKLGGGGQVVKGGMDRKEKLLKKHVYVLKRCFRPTF